MIFNNLKARIANYLVILVVMLGISVVFLNSFYWTYEGIGKRKLLVWAIAFFLIGIVPFLSVGLNCFYKVIEKITCLLKKTLSCIRDNKKKLALFLIITFAGIVLSTVLTGVVSKFIFRTAFNRRLLYTLITFLMILLSVVFLWKSSAQKPERFFCVLALVMGIFSISVTPSRVGVSLDDEVHYAHVLEIADALNGIRYEADTKNILEYADNIYAHAGFDRESDCAYTEELQKIYDEKLLGVYEFKYYNPVILSYVPSAIGVVLGRGLNLSYSGVFNMGRTFNLLLYVTLIALAIKKIKYGKVLIAAIGLIPTTIFMAANYSYDPWVTGFTILGLAYFFSELQTDTQMETKNLLISIIMIAIGCIPKAIYFPILFPLLFIPRKKFKSERQRKGIYLAIIVAGVFLVSTFMLPMLVNGPGTGDLRGGSEVNSVEQIKFMLQNPFTYIKIMLEFDMDYIALENAAPMLQQLGYVGEGDFYSVVSIVLTALAFADRDENEKNHIWIRIAGLIGCAAIIVLATTALYIGFTAVASNTVAGVQARYMIPTIFPALYLIGVGGGKHKINEKAFVCVPMLIIAFTFIYNMFQFCVFSY